MAGALRCWALLLATAAAACTNDFDSFAFAGAGASGATAGSGGAGAAGGNAGSAGDSSGGAASGGVSGTGTGGTGTGGSASGGTSSSGGATGGTVVCEGNTPCALSTSMCCYRFSGPNCQSKDANCGGGADITCDGPEDCEGGEVCCARFAGGGFLIEMQCLSAGDCGGGRRVVCKPDQPKCPDQTQCEKLNQLPYAVCR